MTWDERADDAWGLYFGYSPDGSILVHQEPYIAKALAHFGIVPVLDGLITPLHEKFHVEPNAEKFVDGATADYDTPTIDHREAIGLMLYLRRSSRP